MIRLVLGVAVALFAYMALSVATSGRVEPPPQLPTPVPPVVIAQPVYQQPQIPVQAQPVQQDVLSRRMEQWGRVDRVEFCFSPSVPANYKGYITAGFLMWGPIGIPIAEGECDIVVEYGAMSTPDGWAEGWGSYCLPSLDKRIVFSDSPNQVPSGELLSRMAAHELGHIFCIEQHSPDVANVMHKNGGYLIEREQFQFVKNSLQWRK